MFDIFAENAAQNLWLFFIWATFSNPKQTLIY